MCMLYMLSYLAWSVMTPSADSVISMTSFSDPGKLLGALSFSGEGAGDIYRPKCIILKNPFIQVNLIIIHLEIDC